MSALLRSSLGLLHRLLGGIHCLLAHYPASMQYGGQEISLDSARELHRRASIEAPLEDIFALTDLDKNGKLSFAEFLLFMYLLKLLRKGVALPRQLSYERVSSPTHLNSFPSAGSAKTLGIAGLHSLLYPDDSHQENKSLGLFAAKEGGCTHDTVGAVDRPLLRADLLLAGVRPGKSGLGWPSNA